MTALNVYEEAVRSRKVVVLVTVLVGASVDADTAEQLGENGWRAAAGLAGVSMPSAETKSDVVAALRKLVVGEVSADPFDGLV